MRLEVARTHQPWPGVILRAGDYFGEVPEAIGEALTRRGWFREQKAEVIKTPVAPVDEKPKKSK